MIEHHIKIHDQYSVEFKVGFLKRKKLPINDFAMNIWMFIPNSLDINRYTYSKSDFYRDIINYTRLVTPVYLLRDIADASNLSFRLLEESFSKLASLPTRTNQAEYEYHIRMFVSIVKSALRDEVNHIITNRLPDDEDFMLEGLISNIEHIRERYRNLQRIINVPTVNQTLVDFFLFGDEFLSNNIELQSFKLMQGLKKGKNKNYKRYQAQLLDLINSEVDYRKRHGYLVVEEDSKRRNQDFVFRIGMLKKYAESHLFLNVRKRKDGAFVEQFLYSIAAGISMIFATVIAFSFQRKYGNFTMPLFVALVVGYMLKDRIKEFGRYFFTHSMSKRYFDNKTDMNISQTKVGWVKEAMDFISDSKVPPDVVRLRNRSSILEADNRVNKERVLLYRTRMMINTKKLDANSQYPISGVNSIIRFNISNIIQRIDDPDFPLFIPDREEGFKIIKGEKIYFLNIVIQMEHDMQHDLKRYRLLFNRNGIKKIESFD